TSFEQFVKTPFNPIVPHSIHSGQRLPGNTETQRGDTENTEKTLFENSDSLKVPFFVSSVPSLCLCVLRKRCPKAIRLPHTPGGRRSATLRWLRGTGPRRSRRVAALR